MLFLLPQLAQAVTPFAGLSYTPLSRGDLVWTADQRVSGVGVGEFDGLVRPNLSAFGGLWFTANVGVSGGLGVARLQNTTWVGDTWRQRHWGLIRPHLDVRWAPTERKVKRPFGWVFAGVHGDIPSARDASNGYSEDEEAAAKEIALAERAGLGGIGARLGAGVEIQLMPRLSLGGTYAVTWHRNLLLADDASAVSSFVWGEAALLLTVDWGANEGDSEAASE